MLKVNKKNRDCIIKIIFAIILLISIINAISNNRIYNYHEQKSSEHLLELTKKAGVSFAIARSLNGIISVLQGTELTPGSQATIALGEALDPINDLVEKFSSIMLISLVSLGIQQVILQIGSTIGINLLLPIGILLYLPRVIFPDRKNEKLINYSLSLSKILILAFFLIRLLIPVEVFISKQFEGIIMGKYDESVTLLQEISDDCESEYIEIEQQSEPPDEDEILNTQTVPLEQEIEPEKTGLFSSILSKATDFGEKIADTTVETVKNISKAISSFNIKDRINRIISLLKGSVTYIIDLITIFIIQTILLPIATLFILKTIVSSFFTLPQNVQSSKGEKKDVKTEPV